MKNIEREACRNLLENLYSAHSDLIDIWIDLPEHDEDMNTLFSEMLCKIVAIECKLEIDIAKMGGETDA